MSRDYPDWIQTERAAQAQRSFAGSMPVSRLQRVWDLLEQPRDEDAVDFEIRVWRDAGRDNRRIIRIDCGLSGEVPMLCQRTLKRYMQPIDARARLAVIESEAELSALPEDLEPKVCADGQLKLAELVEDELLLALPLVPVHPGSEPVVQAGDVFESPAEPARSHPFAGLADLRKR